MSKFIKKYNIYILPFTLLILNILAIIFHFFTENNFKFESIAGNFASKEAISKAIGTGIRGFKLKDIEILRDELGKPIVNTYNNLSEICIKYNIKEIKVSISHSKNYAVANSLIISGN